MTLTIALVAGVLFATGTYLLLQKLLSRIIVGLGLIAHAANLVLLGSGGAPGNPPIVEQPATGPFSDPLEQAMVLTAIVITFGVTGLLLALAYRSWADSGEDEVEDDVEDLRIASLTVDHRDPGAEGDTQ
jgi:multicomponent Na+:H+ antiporter subunit C